MFSIGEMPWFGIVFCIVFGIVFGIGVAGGKAAVVCPGLPTGGVPNEAVTSNGVTSGA